MKLAQYISLHRGVVGFLRPLHSAVVPVCGRLTGPGDRGKDAEHQREGFRGPEVSVIGLAAVELLAEVIDHGTVEVAAGVIERSGDVLQLIQVARWQGMGGHTAERSYGVRFLLTLHKERTAAIPRKIVRGQACWIALSPLLGRLLWVKPR